MKNRSFTKSLMLHIRYPWTAVCLFILWIGLAVLCNLLKLSVDDLIVLTACAGAATLAIALMGFKG